MRPAAPLPRVSTRSAGIAQSRGDALGPKLLATPRANYQIGLPRDYLVSCHNTVPGGALDMRADRRVSFPYVLTSQRNGNENGDISN
jgi:hypothetical protein